MIFSKVERAIVDDMTWNLPARQTEVHHIEVVRFDDDGGVIIRAYFDKANLRDYADFRITSEML